MINTLFFIISTMLLSVFDISNIALKGNEVKNTFESFPIALVKDSLISYKDENEQNMFYFQETKLKDNFIDYMTLNLKNYKFKLYFTFVDNIPGKEAPIAQVRFICNYYKNFKVDDHLVFKANLR